jgi:CheY-like chemotaxis protein
VALLDRIVVVVDDDQTRETISALLRSSGYLAFGVHDGAQALEYLGMGLRPCAIVVNLDERAAMRFRAAQVAEPGLAKIPVVVGARLGQKPDIPGGGHAPDVRRLLALVRAYCAGRTGRSDRSRAHLHVARRPRA